MNIAYIRAISYILPQGVLSNEDLVKIFPDWTVEKIAGKIGVSQRHIASVDETASDLAAAAGFALFNEWHISSSEIDFVLFCTQSPDYFLPTSACLLQNKLDIPNSSGALDFNLGCSGYIYGLALAKGLVISGIANNILLLTGETYSKYLHPEDRSNRTIFGDAGTATLVSTSGFAQIGEFELGTNGEGAENLIVKNGASRYSSRKKSEICRDKNGAFKSDNYLYMNGADIFSFTQNTVPSLVEKTLLKNNINKEEINQYIFHQANKYMLNFLRKKMRIPQDRFYYFMEKVGNTVSSSIPIALNEAMKDKHVNNGDKVLLAGYGVGYSWGATLLEFNE
jgi:3-oxoacyl-[acyl-carrier-protein] synthase-3